MAPHSIYPHGPIIAPIFHRSSSNMLKLYQEFDLEHPDPSSIAIRLLQTSCLHNTGKTKSSWIILNEARVLAQHLSYSKRDSLQMLDPVERQLLRHNFWVALSGSRSAVILGDYPIPTQMTVLGCGLEPALLNNDDRQVFLLDPSRKYNQCYLEERLLNGVDICRRLWSAASELIFDIDVLGSASSDNAALKDRRKTIVDLTEAYVNYNSIRDSLPPWLQRPDSIEVNDTEVLEYQKACMWSQRVDVLVTFHSVRLIILRHCAEQKLLAIMGLSNDPLMLAVRKLEFSQEFVSEIENVPFVSLQMNGEPCVRVVFLVLPSQKLVASD